MAPAASTLSCKVLGRGLSHWLPPLFSLPLTSCRAAQAAFSRGRSERRRTLVLDIDDTLLSMSYWENVPDTKTAAFKTYLRPHLAEFLAETEKLFDLVFWTAGTAFYCAATISAMCDGMGRKPPKCYDVDCILGAVKGDLTAESVALAQRQLLEKCLLSPQEGDSPVWTSLSRPQTLGEKMNCLKHLPILGLDLSTVLMIDDKPENFALTPRNGLKIPPFYTKETGGGSGDEAVRFVRSGNDNAVATAPDVRLEL